MVSRERRAVAIGDYTAASLTADELIAACPAIADRLSELPSRTVAGTARYPAWVLAGDDLRPQLDPLLRLLGDYTSDAAAADRVMRLRRDDLGGGTLIEALDDPVRQQLAWQLLASLGDG